MSKNKPIELKVDILPIPPSGKLKAKEVLDWMEKDLVGLQRYASDVMTALDGSRADGALSYLVYEIGYAIEACAESIRTGRPIRVVEHYPEDSAGSLSWIVDLGRIANLHPDVPECDDSRHGHKLVTSELMRRLVAYEDSKSSLNLSRPTEGASA